MDLFNRDIVFNIENLICGQCYNFLSYLYQQRGWKRVALDTCKQIIIENAKITISQSGNIIINTSSFIDLLKAIEHIEEEFRYGRMHYYLVPSEKTTISTTYVDIYKLKEYIVPEETEIPTEWGNIYMKDNIIKFRYNNYSNGQILRQTVIESFLQKEEEKDKREEKEKREESKKDKEKREKDRESKEVKKNSIEDEKNFIEDDDESEYQIIENTEENPEKYLYATMFLFSLIKLGEFVPL